MTSMLPALCDSCRHRTSVTTCTAFPELIPVEILALSGDHRTPVPGDNGIVYDQDPDRVEAFEDWQTGQPVG